MTGRKKSPLLPSGTLFLPFLDYETRYGKTERGNHTARGITMKHRTLLIACTIVLSMPTMAQSVNDIHRKAELDSMLRYLPKSEPWEQWLLKTGELPPDFNAYPDIPYLPELLMRENGDRVTTPEQWQKRRAELIELIQYYITGTTPPPPGNVRAAQEETRREEKLTIHEIRLQFGPDHQAKLNLQLIVPEGKGPFPVFMTQDNHYRWALIAAARGYLGCVYAGADSRDDTGAFVSLWPECDWTKLTRRAWAASRCIDYLATLDFADVSKICLTGHSRNGKLSIIGGCLDPRIAAVISSSSGAGGACTYRLFSESHFGEGIELLTRAFPDWMHPRLRFFAGHENKLPVDQHSLIACIAPRACLISTAYNDDVESVWAIEHTYRTCKKVYELLGANDALQLMYRWGAHETQSQDIETYLDWLDLKFAVRPSVFEESRPIYPTYDDWKKISTESINPRSFPEKGNGDLLMANESQKITTPEQWEKKASDIRRRVEWILGQSPSVGGNSVGDYGSEYTHIAALLSRNNETEGIKKQKLSFGNYIAGDLYFPASAEKSEKKIPAVIWLNSLNPAGGYVPSYHRGTMPHLKLAESGFAVLAFDQIGTGYRLEEITHFYNRYPQWSLLGKMVGDTVAALDVFDRVPFVDSRKIYLVGYDMGGKIALHAAALDARIAGVVSVAGFTPMHLDTLDKGTGGVARWSLWYPLIPRLGAFVGNENRVPYDYYELLASIAPRPALIVSPTLDLQASPKNISNCIDAARQVYKIYNAENNLQLLEVQDYNRYSPELQDRFIPKLQEIAGTRVEK